MRVVVLYNPKAGRGRGERVAQNVRSMLERRGDEVSLLATTKEPPEAFRARGTAMLVGADLLVVAGGDGTLHSTLPMLVGSGVPVYHLAMGTENLFARQFGMDRRPATLAQAMEAWRIADVDVGELSIGGTEPAGPAAVVTPFVLMCSLGPDASVIRRLDEARRGPISHLSYVRPIIAELFNPWLPRLTVEVDGRRVVTDERGMVVIANSRQYAVRIDPAEKASMTDGQLDAVVFPCRGPVSAAIALARCRIRKHGRRVVYKQGRSIRVHAEDPRPPALQIDGECQRVATGPLNLLATVRPAALKVLVPQT